MRTQYQEVQNNTQLKKNQNVNENEKIQLVVKYYPKKQSPFLHKPEFNFLKGLSCNRISWLDFDRGWCCENCENIINEQYQIDKKLLKQ